MIFKAMNADKWLWPIFGCKVGQGVPIGMKLELDVLNTAELSSIKHISMQFYSQL